MQLKSPINTATHLINVLIFKKLNTSKDVEESKLSNSVHRNPKRTEFDIS
jgi:hypothetical protein